MFTAKVAKIATTYMYENGDGDDNGNDDADCNGDDAIAGDDDGGDGNGDRW